MYSPEIIAQERRHQRISATITTSFILLFLILSFFIRGALVEPSEIGDKGYEMAGAIDFGDNRMGGRDVNSLQPTVADPADAAAQQEATPQVMPQPPVGAPQQVLTQQQPSPVAVAPDQQTTNQPTPNPTPTPSTAAAASGANHGSTPGAVGNAGTSSVDKLDPNGLYAFSDEGAGGLQGRTAVALPQPNYNVQEDGELYFELVIAPDGSVSFVKMAKLTNKPGLRQVGMDAIYKWRFSPIPSNKPQVSQTVRVKITFKLKN